MASAPPSTEVEREAMCPICLECLTDPVTLDCRHNFCRSCITRYCEKRAKVRSVKCPLCKTRIQKGNLQPNWQLANIVERIKLGKLTQGKENLCKKHNEKLQLFCKEDEELVCLICEHSPEHNQHSVLLLEKAGQEYKEKIKLQQKSLEKERGNLVDKKLAEELKNQERLVQLEEERQKVSSVFQHFRTFLEEKECLRLSQLDDLKKEIEEKQEENVTKLSKEISRLNKWIKKMERKCQQPESEFLQNIRSTLKNYENKEIGHTEVLSSGLEESLRICSRKNTAIERITEKYKEEAIRLMESCEAALDTYPAPATGPAMKAICQPPGPLLHGITLKPSDVRLAFQGERPRTSRAPTLPPACHMGPVKGPTAWLGKLPPATPTLPACYTCRQPSHIKWDCPFIDCSWTDAWTATQAWRENDGLWAEAENNDLGLQGSEADASGQHQLDPDQELQENFCTWTKGTVAPLLEGCVCGVLCHHGPLWQETLDQRSDPSCGYLAKTSGPSANRRHLWPPGLIGYQGFKGWDQERGGDIKGDVRAKEGVEARKAEGCEGAGNTKGRGKRVQRESRDGGGKAQAMRDDSRDRGEETWNTREERDNVEKDQVPSVKGQERDKGTRGAEARGSQRGRSGDEGMGKINGCGEGEPEGEGSRKEDRDDQGQQEVRPQGQKGSLGSGREQEASIRGARSKRLSPRLSGYRWSLGRGYKIIGHPLPPRAPTYTPGWLIELSSLRGHPAHLCGAAPCEELQQVPA